MNFEIGVDKRVAQIEELAEIEKEGALWLQEKQYFMRRVNAENLAQNLAENDSLKLSYSPLI